LLFWSFVYELLESHKSFSKGYYGLPAFNTENIAIDNIIIIGALSNDNNV